jgi:hypothetical protein
VIVIPDMLKRSSPPVVFILLYPSSCTGLPNVTETLLVVRPSWDASSPNNLAK